jgi:hypothetical protein
MSKQPEIDQIFQKRLYDAQAEPPAFVWENVEKALRKKRRRTVFWILSGTLLLGSIGLYAWWNSSMRPSYPANSLNPQAPVVKSEALPANPMATAPQNPAESSAELPQSTTTATTANAERPNSSHPTVRKSTKSASFLSPRSQSATADQPGSQEKATASPSADNSSNVEQQAVLAAPEINTNQDLDPFSTQNPKHLNLLPLSALSTAEPEWLQSRQADAQIRQIKVARGKRTKKYKNCYDFASHPRIFLLDGYLGLSAVRKDLRIGLPESTTYRNLREATERNSWAFNGGMRGTMLFNQNFLVRAGIHYDQVTEIFEHKDPSYIKIENTIINGVIVDSDTTYGSNFIKAYNRFGMLEIPLEAGFEIRKLRSGLSIQVGAAFNVLFWKRGKIMNPANNNPASIDPSDNAYNTFRNNLGVSVVGSAQWFYHIRPTLRFFAEPYYRHILRPVTKSSHPLEQRYGIGGVRFGLTKILD